MSKKFQIIFLFLLTAFFSVSCVDRKPSEEQLSKIIDNFRAGDYEYITTWYNVGPDHQKEMSYVLEGKKIDLPYEQYEKVTDYSGYQGLIEQYWYTKDEDIIYSIKVKASNHENGVWITNRGAEKETDLYAKEGLSFVYDRKEIISGKVIHVYLTQYETEVNSAEPILESAGNVQNNDPITLTCKMKLEYYIDFSSEEVIRIIIDESDIIRANGILAQITSGKTKTEAESIVDEDGSYDSIEGVIDIMNFGNDIFIEPPEDLQK